MFGLLFSFEGKTSSDLVMKAKWTHLYSSRTQKLSTSAATIAGRAPVKIARCQVGRPVLRRTGFFLYRDRKPRKKAKYFPHKRTPFHFEENVVQGLY